MAGLYEAEALMNNGPRRTPGFRETDPLPDGTPAPGPLSALAPAAPAAAPAAPEYPTFEAPASTDNRYDAAFQSGITQARSNVQAQLRNALGEISRRQGVAAQAVGQLPGQYKSLYDLATESTNQMGAAADRSQANAGIASYAPASSALAPILATGAMQQATAQAGVPLLQLGVDNQAAAQAGQATQLGNEQLGALDSEQRQYSASQSGNEAQRQMQVAQQKFQSQVAAFDANRAAQNRTEDQQRQDKQRAEDAAQAERRHLQDLDHETAGKQQDFLNQAALNDQATQNKKAPSLQGPFGAQETSQGRGALLAEQGGGKLRSDSAYTKLVAELRKNPPADQAAMLASVDKFLKKNKKANTGAVSLALFDLYGVD